MAAGAGRAERTARVELRPQCGARGSAWPEAARWRVLPTVCLPQLRSSRARGPTEQRGIRCLSRLKNADPVFLDPLDSSRGKLYDWVRLHLERGQGA